MMSTPPTSRSKTTHTTSTSLINPYFKEIDQIFTKHNWKKTQKIPTQIIYTSPKNLSNQFIITLNKNNISVSIPLKHSAFNYKTILSNYFTATEYILERFKDFHSN